MANMLSSGHPPQEWKTSEHSPAATSARLKPLITTVRWSGSQPILLDRALFFGREPLACRIWVSSRGTRRARPWASAIPDKSLAGRLARVALALSSGPVPRECRTLAAFQTAHQRFPLISTVLVKSWECQTLRWGRGLLFGAAVRACRI